MLTRCQIESSFGSTEEEETGKEPADGTTPGELQWADLSAIRIWTIALGVDSVCAAFLSIQAGDSLTW